MSDLHCPATLLVARHGDAEYDHPELLTDDGGRLSERGREQARALAESLHNRPVARVFSSTMERARESAEIAAGVLDRQAVVIDGLQEFSVGDLAGKTYDDPALGEVYRAWLAGDMDAFIPGGETGAEVIDRYREALMEIADQHRGETVLVFSHGGVMSFVLPRLGGSVRTDLVAAHLLPNCGVAEVAVNADGFDVLTWPGQPG
ncbi:MAG TPA: histidine phosphatase family protein [Marmoricola sp.]